MQKNFFKSNLLKSIISAILILFTYPLGLVVMWLIAPWSRGFKIFLSILCFFPFILLLTLLPISHYRAKKQINLPLQDYKTYQDRDYLFSFNYPNNWFVRSHDTDPKILEITTNRFLNTPVRTISVTDIPYPTDPDKGKSPSCILAITIHRNPKELSLKAWHEKAVDEFGNPKTEEEQQASKALKKTTEATLNTINVLKTILGGNYLLGKGLFVYKINQIAPFECSNGYKVILNSFEFAESPR